MQRPLNKKGTFEFLFLEEDKEKAEPCPSGRAAISTDNRYRHYRKKRRKRWFKKNRLKRNKKQKNRAAPLAFRHHGRVKKEQGKKRK